MLDPILLGDNPFIGVDHLSQERARLRSQKFNNVEYVVEIIRYASTLGVGGFVASTHPNLKNVIEYMVKSDLHDKIKLYPIIPYAQGYVIKVTEKGMVGALSSILEPAAVQDKMRILIKGGMGLLKKNVNDLFKVFVDVELLQLNGMNMKCIFLHDVLTDLALALGLKDLFRTFIDYVEDKYKTQAGFVTKNFPKLVRQLEEWKIEMPPIMTSFNKVGFQMNPSREECERCLVEYKPEVIAMSTLAAGYIAPAEAYEYLFKLPIKSVVVGVSSKEHAKDTFQLIRSYMK